MRIIKNGRKEKEIECKNCNSIIGYYDNEIRYSESDYFGMYDCMEYIKCPVCKNKIIINSYCI